MNDTAQRPILSGIEPQLFIAELDRSIDFYTGKLGFSVAFTYGHPPHYGQVVRDRARINLRVIDEAVFAEEVRKREALLSASITVRTAAEIELLFLEFKAAGVPFQQQVEKEPWGAASFVVADPDGNLILFAGAESG